MKFIKKISELVTNRNKDGLLIRLDSGIITYYIDSIPVASFSTKEILEVFVFKRDLLTVDCICIGFRLDQDCTFYEIDEEIKGYEEVLKKLPQYFAGIKQDWFPDVAFPAFKTNCQSIWGEKRIEQIWQST